MSLLIIICSIIDIVSNVISHIVTRRSSLRPIARSRRPVFNTELFMNSHEQFRVHVELYRRLWYCSAHLLKHRVGLLPALSVRMVLDHQRVDVADTQHRLDLVDLQDLIQVSEAFFRVLIQFAIIILQKYEYKYMILNDLKY